MYSVIIHNAKTMDSFSQFQPLFSNMVKSGSIGVCKWNEDGTTLDTAVPELANLTNDKEEWRAIIVRYIDEKTMASFSSASDNPYDFAVNNNTNGAIRENPVPLVRLTQMLGGIPPLEVRFAPEVVREKHKAPKTVYKPIEDPEREEAYRSLSEKYRLNGVIPDSILIVTARNRAQIDEGVNAVWENHRESDSSEFWKRNQYPSICRFLTFDFAEKGPVQKQADDFGFWVSVLLLATNDIDSAVLQAYRLYTVKSEFDKEEMTEVFQNSVDKFLTIKRFVEKQIKKEIEKQICEEEPLPDYRLNVPVSFSLPDTSEREVSGNTFPLLSEDTNSDISVWERRTNEIKKKYADAVRSADRTLDQIADRIRYGCKIDPSEAPTLNKYQKEDLDREIHDIYSHIVSLQGELPTKQDASSNTVENEIRLELIRRTLKRPAILTFVGLVGLLLLSMIPAVINWMNGSASEQSYIPLLCIFGAEAVLLLLVAAITLVLQKHKLNSLMQEFNRQMGALFYRLTDNADQYSDYMSSIATHARGASMLTLSNEKEAVESDIRANKLKHIVAINILLAKIRGWNKAFHLNVHFTDRILEERITVDTNKNPSDTENYALGSGISYPVSLNRSGMTIDSPFSFVRGFSISREEIYD